MGNSYLVQKQLIDSGFQNFDWESNPNWKRDLENIEKLINDFWLQNLKREATHQKGLLNPTKEQKKRLGL